MLPPPLPTCAWWRREREELDQQTESRFYGSWYLAAKKDSVAALGRTSDGYRIRVRGGRRSAAFVLSVSGTVLLARKMQDCVVWSLGEEHCPLRQPRSEHAAS